MQVDDSAPAPAEGALVAGTYDLGSRSLYTGLGGLAGPIGDPIRQTFELIGSGTSWTLQVATISPTGISRQTVTLTVAGTHLNLASSCPSGGGTGGFNGVAGFTAATGSLILYDLASSGPVREDAYARR
jgi:hypothetical protein